VRSQQEVKKSRGGYVREGEEEGRAEEGII
jgi:hypothetical protein